jgi:integrase
MVRRVALARGWKWSTTSKALATIQGALLNLPLYTNQLEGIAVAEWPEWRAATKTARRYEHEVPPEAAPPVTQRETEAARRHLHGSHEARLYLGMMWSFAARAADIGSLAAGDVTLGAERSDGTTDVSLTIRRGKGAKFRGPYPIASRLRREDASELRKILAARHPRQRLFANATSMRNLVRAALRKESPLSALSSVRKGAARHLAAMNIPEDELQRLTGHTRPDTLRRYLGYGHQLTREAVAAQANAALTLRELTTSA